MSKMSRRQRIDESREVRLWVTTIIGPVIGGITYFAATHPDKVVDVKDKVVDKFYDIKDTIREKIECWKKEREFKKEIENE